MMMIYNLDDNDDNIKNKAPTAATTTMIMTSMIIKMTIHGNDNLEQ